MLSFCNFSEVPSKLCASSLGNSCQNARTRSAAMGVPKVLQSGLSSAHVSLSSNKYGSGLYFARDPRLAQFFDRDARNLPPDAERKILLCRIIVGWCAKRRALRSRKEKEMPENRKPPDSYHSITSEEQGTVDAIPILYFSGFANSHFLNCGSSWLRMLSRNQGFGSSLSLAQSFQAQKSTRIASATAGKRVALFEPCNF